jgi:hypothetical protein
MALKTIGTTGQTSLSGFVVGTNDQIAADVATLITQLRADPQNINGVPAGTFQPRINQAYVQRGTLFLPNNRGQIKCRNGDYVCWDVTTGWPIVVSGYTATNGPWVHT